MRRRTVSPPGDVASIAEQKSGVSIGFAPLMFFGEKALRLAKDTRIRPAVRSESIERARSIPCRRMPPRSNHSERVDGSPYGFGWLLARSERTRTLIDEPVTAFPALQFGSEPFRLQQNRVDQALTAQPHRDLDPTCTRRTMNRQFAAPAGFLRRNPRRDVLGITEIDRHGIARLLSRQTGMISHQESRKLSDRRVAHARGEVLKRPQWFRNSSLRSVRQRDINAEPRIPSASLTIP